MTPFGYIVTQGGLPCMIYNAAARIHTKRGGVLIPGSPVEVFTQMRDARRAIKRTQRVASSLRGSLIDDWLKLSPLRSGQPYAVVALAKQDQAQLVATLKRLTEPKEPKK